MCQRASAIFSTAKRAAASTGLHHPANKAESMLHDHPPS
jgi:hypothetical protein